MSSTIYNKAFELELSHLFYTAAHKFNVNKQLDLFATSATADLVKKGRMRMVRTGAGLNMFYQAYLDSAPLLPVIKPLIELAGPLEFVFALTIKPTDTSFLNTTNLDQGGTYSSGKIFLLDGNMPTGPTPGNPVNLTLLPSLLDQLRPAVFTYTFLPDNPPLLTDLVLKVYREDEVTLVQTIDPVLSNPSTGIYSAQIDLSKEPIGIYKIEVTDPNNGDAVENTALIYVDSELSRQNIFGIVRLTYTNPDYFYKGLPDIVKYEFVARQVKWRYYVAIKKIATNFFNDYHLEIYDDLMPVAQYTFTGLDGGVPNATVKINGLETVIITSNQLIPFRETAISRFNLKQVKPSPPTAEKVIMNVLPNAATSGVDSNNVGVIGEKYAEIFLFLDQVSP